MCVHTCTSTHTHTYYIHVLVHTHIHTYMYSYVYMYMLVCGVVFNTSLCQLIHAVAMYTNVIMLCVHSVAIIMYISFALSY